MKFLVGLFISLLVCTQVKSQTISYSPYSAFGIGLPKEKTSAYNRSMAETGIAVRNLYSLNNLNPASYTSLQTITQITELGLYFEKAKLSNRETSQISQLGSLSAINFWFRGSKRWGANIGLAPYSTVNYNISADTKFNQSEDVTINYTGEGGLNQFYFGNGIQVYKNLSVGFNLSYVFGKIQKNETVLSGEYTGLMVSNSTYMKRLNIDYGIQYTFNLKNNRSLNFGLIYTDKFRLNTSRKISVLESSTLDSLYVKRENVRDYVLPGQLGIGVAYETPYHVLAMDLKMKAWEDAILNEAVSFQNTTRLSVGYEFKGKQVVTNWASFIALRAGAFIQNNYLVLNNNPFYDLGFTLGTGIPVGGNRGLLNLSYSFNSTGTTNNKLIYQNAHIIVIDIAMRDIWGIRKRFD